MRAFGAAALTLAAALMLAGLGAPAPTAATADGDVEVYGDALAAGWQDWSWSTSRDYAATSPVHSGVHSLAVTHTVAWGGLYLHAASPLPGTDYEAVRFWVHGGSTGGQAVVLALYDQAGGVAGSLTLPLLATTWSEVEVPLSALGSPSAIGGLVWQDGSGGNQPTYFLDDVVVVARTGPPPPTPTPGPGPSLAVDVTAGRHPILPAVYGMNFADEGLAEELRLPVRRWGGNHTSRFNYFFDTTNVGSDWYFENIPQDNPDPGTLPDGNTVDRFVEQDLRTGTRSLVTLPLVGSVAKRRLPSHPYDCGYKVSLYGAQQSVDPWDPDCGNGVLVDGTEITWNDPADTSVGADPGFVAGFVAHLVGRFGGAADGGVGLYELDNEPMLWYETHRDVHPQPTSYDEMRDRTLAFAAAVKQADPAAQTLGPSVWGWTAYFWSALDWESGGSWWTHPQDRLAHGDVPFVDWYLQQLATWQAQHGLRLLDYLDVHFYPPGVALAPAGDPDTQALRLRSTRLLWDPTYVEESWIAQPVYLVSRLHGWADTNYPGTRTAVTEYNWGALDHLNGALAQADVLGIFGREGLHLATLWGPPSATEPGAFAFRMFRNVDGAGRAFGETSVAATSSDQGLLSLYAGVRIVDGALTLVAVNKSAENLTSLLQLAGFEPTPAAAVYRYSAADLTRAVREPDQAVTGDGFTHTFPAASVTFLDLPLEPTAPLRCDCDGDRTRTVGDLAGLAQELHDGDGLAAAAVPGGAYPGDAAGCDATADAVVDAGDVACTITTLTLGPDLCGSRRSRARGASRAP